MCDLGTTMIEALRSMLEPLGQVFIQSRSATPERKRVTCVAYTA